MAVAEAATEAETSMDRNAVGEAAELEEEDTGVGDSRADARGEGEVPTDQEVNRANEYLPSAMGISALVRLPGQLRIHVTAGSYTKAIIQGLGRLDKDGKWQPHWLRQAVESIFDIDCSDLKAQKRLVRSYPVKNGDTETTLRLHVFSRPHALATNPDADRIITFTLLNDRSAVADRPRDEECFFQCSLKIAVPDGPPCFLEYPDRISLSLDEEEQSLRLLFSHVKTFAVGHGCAADWEAGNTDAVFCIRTQTLPTFEIKPIVPTRIKDLDLSMLALSTVSFRQGCVTEG
jgi:hypothetical protein